ncbi:MAG TPA: thioredoxin [Xanthomonadaceae bacterium]|jgi:thiol-disulfide isomerase/thioredoxin|nr:thioredoxin [Xanthomonadaceae bacterium]
MRPANTPIRALALAVLVAGLSACRPAGDAASEAHAAATTAVPPTDTAPTDTAPSTDSAPAPAGKPTHPRLVVDTLDHGRFDLAEHRGGWAVVNFWATWCAPCLKEIPDLNALDARRADLVVIGLAYEEITPEAMRAFYVDKVRPEYPVSIIDPFAPPADFDTPRGLPFTVLIDPQGAVVHQFLGPVTGAEIEAKISALKAASMPA